MSTQYTVGQLADKLGTNPEALRKRLSRTYADKYPGQSWGASAVVPDELASELLDKSGQRPARQKAVSGTVVLLAERPAEALTAGKSAKEKRPRSVSAKTSEVIRLPEKPDTPPARQALPDLHTVRRFSIRLLLFVAVIGHAGLVWYDLATLWGVPGTIGGGLMFAVMLAALGLASDPALPRTSEAALWFVALLDCAAYFVHFEVFDRPDVQIWFTRALCALICACSWACLYLFRDSKLD